MRKNNKLNLSYLSKVPGIILLKIFIVLMLLLLVKIIGKLLSEEWKEITMKNWLYDISKISVGVALGSLIFFFMLIAFFVILDNYPTAFTLFFGDSGID